MNALATTVPTAGALLTLEQYMQWCLDEIQAETRSMIRLPGLPPSGQPNDRPTLVLEGDDR